MGKIRALKCLGTFLVLRAARGRSRTELRQHIQITWRKTLRKQGVQAIPSRHAEPTTDLRRILIICKQHPGRGDPRRQPRQVLAREQLRQILHNRPMRAVAHLLQNGGAQIVGGAVVHLGKLGGYACFGRETA